MLDCEALVYAITDEELQEDVASKLDKIGDHIVGYFRYYRNKVACMNPQHEHYADRPGEFAAKVLESVCELQREVQKAAGLLELIQSIAQVSGRIVDGKIHLERYTHGDE